MNELKPMKLAIVGDVMIYAPLAERYRRGDSQFQHLVTYLKQSDMVIANLEMPLSRRGYRMPKLTALRSDPVVIEDIRAMGIGAVTLANNHMLDYGPDALFDTLETCERAGIWHFGAGPDLNAALEPFTFESGALTVAILGVACTLPVGSNAAPDRPGIAPIRVETSLEVDPNLFAEQPGMAPIVRSRAVPEDQELVCKHIEQLKQQGAFVIVKIHWGVPDHWLVPRQGLLAEYQQPLGRSLIDAGADIVCGHHSHTLHPIELYRGRPIFYSLGNFLFEGPFPSMEPASYIVEVAPHGDPQIELVPIVLDEQGFPRLTTETEANSVIERLDQLSQPFGVAITAHESRGRIDVSGT